MTGRLSFVDVAVYNKANTFTPTPAFMEDFCVTYHPRDPGFCPCRFQSRTPETQTRTHCYTGTMYIDFWSQLHDIVTASVIAVVWGFFVAVLKGKGKGKGLCL